MQSPAEEWTKPVEATYNVDTGDTRQTSASTNFMDSDWSKIKEQVPRGLSVKTLAGFRLKMRYVRWAQWRKMTRGEDKWQAFCEAAFAWRASQKQDQEQDDDDAHVSLEEQSGPLDIETAFEDDATI